MGCVCAHPRDKMRVYVFVSVGQGANPTCPQGHRVNRRAAGSAEPSTMSRLSDYRRKANAADRILGLPTFPLPAWNPLTTSLKYICLLWTHSTQKLQHCRGMERGNQACLKTISFEQLSSLIHNRPVNQAHHDEGRRPPPTPLPRVFKHKRLYRKSVFTKANERKTC